MRRIFRTWARQSKGHTRAKEVEGAVPAKRLQERDLQGEGGLSGGDPQLLQGGQFEFVTTLRFLIRLTWQAIEKIWQQ